MNMQDAGDTEWQRPLPSSAQGETSSRPSSQPSLAATKLQEEHLWLYVGLLAGALIIGGLWKLMVHTIPAGHHGVVFHRLSEGTSTDRGWNEGLYIIAPWNKLITYETRLQTRTISLKIPSVEGMEMSVSITLRYRPDIESLGYLHKDIGPDYFERLILPEVHGHLRKILGKRSAQVIYTGGNDVLDEIARVPVINRLNREGVGAVPKSPPYVLVEELRVLDLVRPTTVADAVNEKQRQEQLSLEYKHRLQREEQEAARKRVEAAGIRDYNLTIGKLSPDVLQWRSMDSTLELARSNNAKVVVLGDSHGVPPMTLNLGDSPSSGQSSNERTPATPQRSNPSAKSP